MLVDFLRLMRPQQWAKNLFIFLPLFFSRNLFVWDHLQVALIVFFAYCLTASAIYCFNDIWDREADRRHPQKRWRPIASGQVSVAQGYGLMALCLAGAVALAWLLPRGTKPTLCILAFYFVMNIAYCMRLKNLAIVDVFIIAVGFVLRIMIGGLSTGIFLSHWIILMTFLLALFLAFAKRRDDVVLYENTGAQMRKNVNRYNLTFMNQAITITATLTMVCYIMYTISDQVMGLFRSRYVFLTSIWVLAGIIKYLQITIVDVKSGSPTKVLLRDHFIQGCIAGWMLHFLVIIYLLR